ncbi:MAG: hypothetical protein ACRDDZ_06210 [Marinifilaceae bacterium]
MMNLHSLPSGSSYSDKSGRANVKVEVVGDTIYVYATCDSLQRRVEYLQDELTRIRNDTSIAEKNTETERISLSTLLKWFLFGMVFGMITITIYKFIKFK